jgi:trimethyllysine dioxygenase
VSAPPPPLCAHAAVFELDRNGVVRQFRYNNDDRAPLNTLPPEDVSLFYRYLRVLNNVTLDPTLSGFLKLQVGSGVLVHNHRVLHGRRSFIGARNLQGWYLGKDEFHSCLRLLDLL